jgi:Cu/Ag efflux protein CusF
MKTETQQEICLNLMKSQKVRRNIVEQMRCLNSRAVAFIAARIGYDAYEDKAERKRKWAQAEKIFKITTPEKTVKELTAEVTKIIDEKERAAEIVEMTMQFTLWTKTSLNGFAIARKQTEDLMVEDAEKLPVTTWWNSERGRGLLGLAVIIGEAGNLSDYANPAKLWKRFGLAVMDGVRQGGLPKTANKEEWIKHGYNSSRRSVVWTVGDSLLKGNSKEGFYKKIYDEQKKYYTERLEKKCKEEGTKFRPIIPHRQAQRYMEKRLLRDLWNKWNRHSLNFSYKK